MTSVWRSVPLLGSSGGLLAGIAAWIAGADGLAAALWGLATVVALVPALAGTVRSLLRREAGVDVLAVLAMVGAIALQEWFAGAVIAMMLTGGEALERYASARARRDLTALLERAPKSARVEAAGGDLRDVDVHEVVIGDLVHVRIGEVVPVDGVVVAGPAVVDESALTGEPVPVERGEGEVVRSGSLNVGRPVRMRATASAADSAYESIVRLVREAERARPRFVRMADRYAAWFTPFALVVAGASWALSGEAVRALAVVVVATPCPLLLAAPAALVSGVSRAARDGIVVKGGLGLEALAQARVALLDKTGTITYGSPHVAGIEVFTRVSRDEVLRLAAAVDQVSVHPFAPAIVAAANQRGLVLPFPEDVDEELGAGVQGRVDGHLVRLGRLDWLEDDRVSGAARQLAARTEEEGVHAVFLARDGDVIGAVLLDDPIDPASPRAIADLRGEGVDPIVLVTGDRRSIAERVGAAVGVDEVLAGRTPQDKVDDVKRWSEHGPTLMAGDGVNDAPALAAADVGVAMGARGATAASEAADVVIIRGGLDGVAAAVRIAHRTRRIARQSAGGGMGLAGVAMLVAAFGYLPPATGALVQEAIDLAVIGNALRALRFRI